MSRHGIRVGDLLRPDRLRDRVTALVDRANAMLEHFDAPDRFEASEVYETLRGHAERLEPYVADTVRAMHDAYADGQGILLEGAQGAMLDIDHGTWPYVTSSNTTAGAACAGSGLPPTAIDRVFGVVKAYTTRVGAGPFTAELSTDEGPGKHLAEVGHEFGTTTGRPRRCGWLDTVVVDHSIRLSGIDQVAFTKLDVLAGLPEVKVAVAYEIDGTETDRLPGDTEDQARAAPVYETLPGWEQMPPAERVRGRTDLPQNARAYLDFVEEALGVPYAMIGTGPKRDETIVLLDD